MTLSMMIEGVIALFMYITFQKRRGHFKIASSFWAIP